MISCGFRILSSLAELKGDVQLAGAYLAGKYSDFCILTSVF